MLRLAFFLFAAAWLAGCVSPPQPGTDPLSDNVIDWRDEVIYQIMTDRFSDGDPYNNYSVDPDDISAYQGGDWRGIAERLTYLEQLGVTTLWISPVVKNVEWDAGFAYFERAWDVVCERLRRRFEHGPLDWASID